MTGVRRRLSPATLLAISGGVASTLFSLVFQRPGVLLSADGWAYWEGSVSLLQGEGYRYFGGQPIVAWPPGFSAYLALWQLALGISAGTLAIAHACALGIAAGLWIAAAVRVAPKERLGWPTIAVATILSFLIPICLRLVLSESLFMVWLGAALLVAIGGARGRHDGGPMRDSRWVHRGLAFALVAAALLLTRHAGAAFLPALLWLFWRSEPMATTRARAVGLLAVAGTLGVWLAARVGRGQFDNNPRALLDSTFAARLAESLGANLAALWSSLVPVSPTGIAASGVAIGAIFLLLGPRDLRNGQRSAAGPEIEVRGLSVATVLAAGCGAFIWALYGVSGRRIVLPAAAFLVLLLFHWRGRAASPKARRLLNALLVLLALVQAGRAMYWVRYGLTLEDRGLGWNQTLVQPCGPGEECSLGPDEVRPRDLPWIDREFNRRTSHGALSP